MNELERSLRQITADLTSLDQRFALVGGLAVSARAEPRLTRDADLAVAASSDADAESAVVGLRAKGYEVVATLEHEATGRLATVRLTREDDRPRMITDLLFASCGIEGEIVGNAEQLNILPDLSVPVAMVGHLLAMKLLARDDRQRPTDADDLAALAAVAKASDWDTAAEAVRLIAARGYARDRDLVAALSKLRARGAY